MSMICDKSIIRDMCGGEQQTEKVASCGYCQEWVRKSHCTKRVLSL